MDDPRHEQDDHPIRPERYEVLDSDGNPVHHQTPRQRRRIPFISLAILGTCILIFIVVNLVLPLIGLERLLYLLTFSPANGLVFPGILTHMFAHASVSHILFNMIMLFFLGTMVEARYGTWPYVVLYFGSGIFAALAQAAANPEGLLLGASGALAGVLAAFIRHYPHVKLYVWGLFPVPAWLVGLLWMAYNIFGTLREWDGVAFIAHLAGFAAGMVISLLLYPPGRRGQDRPRENPVQ